MDSVRSGPFGQIFRPDNFVFGASLIDFVDFFLKAMHENKDVESPSTFSL